MHTGNFRLKPLSNVFRLLAVVLSAVALVVTTTMTAHAVAPLPNGKSQNTEKLLSATPQQLEQMQILEAKLEPIVEATTTGRVPTFDPVLAIKLGAEPEIVHDYATTLVSEGGKVLNSGTWEGGRSAHSGLAQTAAACSGSNGYTGYYFTGFQWALNSCNTDKLIALAGAGTASIGAIAAMLAVGAAPAAAVTGVAAAIAAAGAGFLNVCKSFGSNGGIYVNSGNLSLPTCWGQ
jgi:hypothetical protein